MEGIQVEKRYNMSKLDRHSGNIIMCVTEGVVGILLPIDPRAFTGGIIILFGVLLVLNGVRGGVHYWRTDPETAARQNSLTLGLTSMLAGLFCIFQCKWFLDVFPDLPVFYGLVIQLFSISKIQWGIDLFRSGHRYWYITLIGALISLVLAAVVLVDPFSAAASLWKFAAVSLIAEAVLDVISFLISRI